MAEHWTVAAIKAVMTEAGSHWWEPSSMKFFGTRVLGAVQQGPGGVYFVTSEAPPHGPRMCSVRRYDPEARGISTVGEFCALTPREAHRLARRMAEGLGGPEEDEL